VVSVDEKKGEKTKINVEVEISLMENVSWKTVKTVSLRKFIEESDLQ
jgi:hypothetical protein